MDSFICTLVKEKINYLDLKSVLCFHLCDDEPKIFQLLSMLDVSLSSLVLHDIIDALINNWSKNLNVYT